MIEQTITLRDAWRGIQQAKPGIRIREAAKELGVSEAELLATRIGDDVTLLQASWSELLQRFKTLGRVMSLTRNDACILEHKGAFEEVNVSGEGARAMATVIGAIETRVFFNAWHVAFAAIEKKEDRVLKSIQVFDQAGEAITKIYLQDKSDAQAFDKLVHDFRAADQRELPAFTSYKKETTQPIENAAVFLNDWSELKDTHAFFGMLRKHKVQRYQALELAEGMFTKRVNARRVPQQIVEEASATKLPIMIFAGNRGNLQIHQGKVRTIRVLEQGHGQAKTWLNILDPDFNMHLNMDLVEHAWVVKKPTSDGEVTSVELFDAHHNMVAQFFGLRKPGTPELDAWKELVNKLI